MISILKTTYFLLFILALTFRIQAQESFVAASIQVSDSTVSRQTTLGFQLFLSSVRVVNSDYLIILLSSGVRFRTTTTPSCSFTSLTVTSCQITSSTEAKIVFSTSSQAASIEGTISNFINPDSVRTISNIELYLYSGTTNTIKASTQSASLSNFQSAVLSASISSSSAVVGATNAQLIVSLTPSTVLKASGGVVITIPQYYTNAGSSYMIASSSPTCSGLIGATAINIVSCSFSGSSLQISVSYTITAGTDSTSNMKLTISSFRNPITTQTKSGFSVMTQDSNGYLIETISSISLSGITTPASFQSSLLSLVDSSLVQTYTGIQFRFSLAVPLEQGCYMKLIFPSDFTIDDKLTLVTGSGFFRTSSTSNIVTMIQNDPATRTIVIPACNFQYGPDQAGILTFNQIKNPDQVKATGAIQIFLAKDLSFSINIAQISSSQNFIAAQSLFTYGSISNILVTAVDSIAIQTSTAYQISFTPDHALPATTSLIVIQFPSLITLTSSGCTIRTKSSRFDSSSIACSITGQVVTITSPFATRYSGGTQLQLSIESGINPQSERDAGTFQIFTYVRISSVNYIVDQGVSAANQIVPVGGQIFKAADIIVTSPVTYLSDQVYQFAVTMQHKLPQDGYLNFTIPKELSISSSSMVTNNCIRVDTSKNMNCQVVNSSQIQIHIDSRAFSDGIAIGSVFTFSVAGLKNPRSTATTGLFYFSSYDADMKRIDSSTQYDYFTATMTSLSAITSITIDKNNNTNNALSNYTFNVIPNTPILTNDFMEIGFPSEVSLPEVSNLQCSIDDSKPNGLEKVQCSKKNQNTLFIQFSEVSSISAGQSFSFTVQNVRNPISTQPSSAFFDIKIGTIIGAYDISQYTKTDLTVVTDTSSNINNRKLSQSNKNPSEFANFTITFTTTNPIPSNAAILINAPSIIGLSQNSYYCYAALTQVFLGVCIIDRNLIKVEGAFTKYTNYIGEVSIIFLATNPGDNSNLQSIILRIYTDNTYAYRINKIESGLMPTLECNYPCRRCDQNNPDYCTDCFNDTAFPQFIQKATDAQQTCVYKCSDGYTSNGSKSPKTCQKCDSKCNTCYQQNKDGDINKCLTCSSFYPYFYTPKITCQEKCFDGQFTCKTQECCECSTPCRTCLSSTLCKTCYQDSTKPLLWIDKCVSECPSGFTKLGFDCLRCTSPCATCMPGSQTSCITCDGKNGYQLLFGRQCLQQCPLGTTPQYSNITQSRCVGCQSGCEVCDKDDNSICLKCEVGLALHENQCLTECPFNYIKSKDGTACELRTYLLNASLIYFPFAGAAVLVIIICIVGFFVSKNKSLILSNCAALLGFIEWGCLLYQIYYAYTYEINYTIISLASFGILCGLYLLNLAFVIFYCARIMYSDIGFNYWRQNYFCTTLFMLFFSLCINFKLFRFLYSRFFGMERFSAKIDDKASFTRKVQIFSIISIFTFTLPLCALDAIILLYLSWGSQLYITCAESGGISFIGALLMIFDNCCMCSRLSYHEELQEQKAKRKARLLYSQLDQSKVKDQLLMAGAPGYDEESKIQILDREEALKEIISQVKNNRELLINNQFDALLTQNSMNSEARIESRFIRRVNSMQNILVVFPDELIGEDDRRTISYDGYKAGESRVRNPQTINDQSFISLDKTTMLNNKKQNQAKDAKNQKFVELLQQEYKFDNVYADAVDPPPPPPPPVIIPEKPETHDFEIQTDKVSMKSRKSSSKGVSRQNSIRAADNILAENSIESLHDDLSSKRRKKKKQRGKNKNQYYTQINEEDQEDNFSLEDNADTQREFLKTAQEIDEEEEDSETEKKNLKIQKKDSRKSAAKKSSKIAKSLEKVMSDKSMRSRSSAAQSQKKSISQQQQQQLMSYQSEKQIQSQILKLEVLQNQYETEYFNQRTFNINDIIGEFVRNWKGGILNKREQVLENNLRDMKGRVVNRRGYLIDENIGCILNKNNLNLMFKIEEIDEDGDIPMPYKFERYNFNPHEIMGNFDYDTKNNIKPIILKNKQGQLVDKHLRQVNPSGFLVDENENIIDNFGKIKFIRQQLSDIGDLPMLFNFKGKQFDIRSVIGVFNRDAMTKQIILNPDMYEPNTLVDKLGRKVNPNGYLVDKIGNIINQDGKIVFFKSQLMFNEPPKLFPFMKFKIEWLIGNLDFDGQRLPMFTTSQVQENLYTGKAIFYDNDGKLVNRLGFLVDEEGNILDKKGNVFIRKDLLVLDENKKANQLPKLFRMGVLYSGHKSQQQVVDNVFEQNLLNEMNQDLLFKDEEQVLIQEQLEMLQQSQNLQNIAALDNHQQLDRQLQLDDLVQKDIVNINIDKNMNKSTVQILDFQQQAYPNQQQQQMQLQQISNNANINFNQPQPYQLNQYPQQMANNFNMDTHDIASQNNYLDQEEGMSDPEPLMDKIKNIPNQGDSSRHKKRKQSALPARSKQVRQGEKVLNAYSIQRPISSYLPQKYQNRAKSQLKQRSDQRQTMQQLQDSEYNTRDQQTRLMSSKSNMNMTANIHSSSGIFKQNAISALGFTDDFSGQNNFQVKKNQYMVSNHDPSDDQSYNNFLEGDVDQMSQSNNFNFTHNDDRLQRKIHQRRIKQNESQVDKIYAEEVNKYIDQSEDEDDDAIFNENFNIGQKYRDEQNRSNSRKRHQRSNLKMYEQDMRSDSRGSNDSQLSRRGPTHLQRSKQQLKRMDSKLKHLEQIYLHKPELSTKNVTAKSKLFGDTSSKKISRHGGMALGGTSKLRALQDQYYDSQVQSRDVSPLSQGRSQIQQYGRRR